MGRKLGYREGMLPVTESVSKRVLRLPFYYELSDESITRVAHAIWDFYGIPVG